MGRQDQSRDRGRGSAARRRLQCAPGWDGHSSWSDFAETSWAVAAVNRCCPPANRPTPLERDTCLPYLAREIELLDRLRVLVALGSFAWDGALRALAANGHSLPRPRPPFRHLGEARIGPYTLLG